MAEAMKLSWMSGNSLLAADQCVSGSLVLIGSLCG